MKRFFQCLTILLVVILMVLGWLFYKEWNEQTVGDKEWKEIAQKSIEDKKYLQLDWQKLKSVNEDVIGWLYVPSCGISYPVLQDSNNAYYINHTMYGTYDESGSIFLNADNQSNFDDTNSIIYGHSVQYLGGMFTNIRKFKDSNFFASNPYFYLLTPNGNFRCKVSVFAQTNDQSVYYELHASNDKDEKMQYAATLSSNAMYGELTVEDINKGLVTLSTCNLDYGLNSNQRLVLVGVKEKYHEDIPL